MTRKEDISTEEYMVEVANNFESMKDFKKFFARKTLEILEIYEWESFMTRTVATYFLTPKYFATLKSDKSIKDFYKANNVKINRSAKELYFMYTGGCINAICAYMEDVLGKERVCREDILKWM